MFRKNLFLIFILVLLLLPSIAFAVPGLPIVQCGTSATADCTRCDLFKLLKNLIDFTVGVLMPAVAILLFVWAGFLILLGGANTNLVTQGRQIFSTTFFGILITLSAWMITNTLIQSVGAKYNNAQNWWQFTCVETVPAQPPTFKYSCNQNNQCVADSNGTYTTSNCDNQCALPPIETIKYSCNSQGQCARDPNGQYTTPTCNNFCQPGTTFSITTANLSGGTVGQPYNQTIQVSGGTTPYGWTQLGSLPAGLSFNTATGVILGTPTAAGTSNFTIRVTDNSTPSQSAEKQFSIVVVSSITPTLTCGEPWEQNLCQPRQMTCGASACNQYIPAINQYAGRTGVANGANFLKAIMIKESACNAQADSGHAQGLMQLKASTANIYKSRCGVSENITSQWLKDNPVLSICIAAEYMKALAQTSCGSTPRGVAAGYNGGSGACQQSRDCAGETSCAGGSVQRWECLYDNPQQTVCNTGYTETRDYATKVLYCYNNPGF